MTVFKDSIVEEFTVKSKEHLASIEGDLLAIENDRSAINPDSINKIFRAIHSIKVASGFLGFTTIRRLSHVMETLLSFIKSNKKIMNNEIIDGLINGVDYLAILINDIKTTHIEGTENNASAIFTIDSNLADSIPLKSQFIYILEYDLSILAREKISPVYVLKELSNLGVIIDTKVEKSNIDLKVSDLSSKLIIKILYATRLFPYKVNLCVWLKEDKIKPVTLEMITGKKKYSKSAKPKLEVQTGRAIRRRALDS